MDKIKARFIRVFGGKSMRTDFVEGYYYYEPKEGKGFKFYGKSLHPDKQTRLVYTSKLEKVETFVDFRGYLLHTVNGSIYMVDNHAS